MKLYLKYLVLSLAFVTVLEGCAASKKTASAKKNNPETASEEDVDAGKLAEEQLYIDAAKDKILENYPEAIKQYKDVLKLDPANDAAQYELAMLYFNAGKNDVARQYIDQAVAYDSINFVKDYVARAREKQRSSSEKQHSVSAKALAAEAQSAFMPNKWYLVLQADVHSSQADYANAIKIYQKLLGKYPDEIDYYFDWAYALIQTGKYQDAMKIYDKLEELVGIDESISVQKERLYLQMGQLDKAVAEIKKLIETDNEDPHYYQMLADLYQANDKTDSAVKVFDEILKISPGNPYALLNLAEIYRVKGDEAKYMDYLQQAFANKDLGVEAKIRVLFPYVSLVAKDSVKKAEAFSLARIMVSTHPDEAKAHAMYGDLLSQDNQLPAALNEYQVALEKDSGIFEIWQQVFFIQAQQKKYADLAKSTEKALELFPNQPLVYFFNGLAYEELKDYQKAVASLNTSKSLAADNTQLLVQIYSTLGDTYNNMGEYNASDSAFENALALDKNNTYVLNNYSYYLSVRSAKLDKAKTMSLLSNTLEPTNASFQDTYAWILYKLGDYAEAKVWIEKAVATLGDSDATILEHYGDILYKLGDVVKALENWQKAARLGSESKLLEKKIADKKLYE